MKRSSSFVSRLARRCWSAWLIVAVLFMQLATAAHACPLRPQLSKAASAAHAEMPCAHAMGQGGMAQDAAPALCKAHCNADAQGTEPAPAAALAMPMLVALFPVGTAVVERHETSAWEARRSHRNRAPPPPHSVLHCCYRI